MEKCTGLDFETLEGAVTFMEIEISRHALLGGEAPERYWNCCRDCGKWFDSNTDHAHRGE